MSQMVNKTQGARRSQSGSLALFLQAEFAGHQDVRFLDTDPPTHSVACLTTCLAHGKHTHPHTSSPSNSFANNAVFCLFFVLGGESRESSW